METTTTNPTETTAKPTTFAVLESKLDDVRKRVEALQRRMVKQGLQGLFTVEFSALHEHRVSNPRYNFLTGDFSKTPAVDLAGEPAYYIYSVSDVTVTVTQPVSLGGWSLAGVLSREGEAPINTIRTVPGTEVVMPERFRTSSPCTCEHCNKPRNRTETFVLRHEGGDFKQVGRQCLRDFLGHDPVKMLQGLQALTALCALGGESEEMMMGGGSGCDRMINLSAWLTAVSRVIAKSGFVSVKASIDGNSTSSCASNLMFTRDARSRAELEDYYPVTERSAALYEFAMREVMRFRAVTDYTTLTSDYERNLYAAVYGDAITSKSLGIVASIVSYAERRENGRVQRERKVKAASTSKHVGTVGERFRNLDVTVEFRKVLEGQFGATTLLKFRDKEGNAFTWFASGALDIEVGAVGTLTATIKAHEFDKYTNGPVTMLSRSVFTAKEATNELQ